MDEAKARRDEIADGVSAGYVEAQVSARVWKPLRPLHRPWREPVRRKGMTGAALVAWVRGMAVNYPASVKVH